ncbi:MAG: helix-turn-helix domain-containing protein [Candidatus Caldatribacterium sp.]|nr:helix-turn-helix domain-containing protein [Candidatus Caldatribacterium sp.]
MRLYQELKASGNPHAPAQVIISLLEEHTPQEVAQVMGVSVRWVYRILERFRASGGSLSSCIRKRGPQKPPPHRTPSSVEEAVVQLARTTNFGPHRLSLALRSSFGITLSPYTIRNILRRHHVRHRRKRSRTGQSRYFVNLEAFEPLKFWQIDVKYIADQKALPSSAYAAIFQNKLPRYQFTAIDVRTRVRFLAYAKELSFANGLTFLLLVVFWLRALGVQGRFFLQTDNGVEFGGLGNSRKRILMEKYIFNPLGVTLLSTPVREKKVNTFVERSHRTDDEEFYALNLAQVTSRKSFLAMAQRWVLYYNFTRPHMGREMQGRAPMEVLSSLRKGASPVLGAFPVLVLDRVSAHLSRLWDISRIPWDNSPKNKKEGLVNETLEHYMQGMLQNRARGS